MKRFISICILVNVALLLWRCHRNRGDEIKVTYHNDCYAGSFVFNKFGRAETLIDAQQLLDNTFAVMTQLNSKCTIYRFDSRGEVMSKTTIALPNDAKAINIIPTNDGGFIISAAVDIFIDSTAHYVNSTAIFGPSPYASYCNLYTSNLGKSITFHSVRNISNSFLIKVNSKGSIVWRKNYRGNSYTGGSLAQLGRSFLYLENRSNLSDSIIHGVADTLKFNYARHNTLILHNIDFAGTKIWDKEFDNVSAPVNCSQMLNGATPPFQAAVKVSGSNILVQSGFSLFLLDINGSLVDSNNFSSFYCSIAYPYNEFYISFKAALDQNSYALLMPFYSDGPKLVTFDFNNRIQNIIPVPELGYGSPVNFLEDANNNYDMYGEANIVRLHKNGAEFTRISTALIAYTNILLPTCDNGLLFGGTQSFQDSSGFNGNFRFLIVKTNMNGEF